MALRLPALSAYTDSQIQIFTTDLFPPVQHLCPADLGHLHSLIKGVSTSRDQHPILYFLFTPYLTLSRFRCFDPPFCSGQTLASHQTLLSQASENPVNSPLPSLLSAGIPSKCINNRAFLSISMIAPCNNIVFIAIMKHQKQGSYEERRFI